MAGARRNRQNSMARVHRMRQEEIKTADSQTLWDVQGIVMKGTHWRLLSRAVAASDFVSGDHAGCLGRNQVGGRRPDRGLL